jgi:hypothetical protein
MLIENDARLLPLKKLGEQRLSPLDWLAAQIPAVQLKQVESHY